MLTQQTLKLASDYVMPRVALGTWKSPKEVTKQAVINAIKSGYRAIDCANDYQNEHAIGEALKECFEQGIVKREELFIQCKLWNANHRFVREDALTSMSDLGLDYLDAYLIHWPQACPATGKRALLRKHGSNAAHHTEDSMFPLDDEGFYMSDKESHFMIAWHVMEELVNEGKIRSIGVSNFNKAQLKEVVKSTKKVPVSILQNESHPYLQEKDLRDYCSINNIVFQSFSPLGSGDRPYKNKGSVTSQTTAFGYELLQDPNLKKIGDKYGKSIAQVILNWHMCVGGAVCPKSVNENRIKQNIEIFDFQLNQDDINEISKLNIGWRHLIWAETSHHPDYPFKDELDPNYVLEKPMKNTVTAADAQETGKLN